MYVRFGAAPPKVPLVGWVKSWNVIGRLSGLLPVSVTATGPESSKVPTTRLVATGMSFTGLIVISTVAVTESAVLSFTLKVKLSDPSKLADGV